MNPHVFREYDIRGVADVDLKDDFVRDLGRALGTFWRRRDKQRVAVGRDIRLSSDRIFAALSSGIRETGCSVVDVGMGPTPLLYFAVFHGDLDGGVQITGSHNPPDYNGFKMMCGKDALFGDEIQELRKIIEAKEFIEAPLAALESVDAAQQYVAYMKANLPALGSSSLRFAVDAGNGAGGPLASETMHALGLRPHLLLCEPDGRFPVHHPDPTELENMELLIERVRSEKLDVGIAYDGDADRLGVVDAEGNVIWGDKLLTLFARDLLERHPGAAVLGEVKCSRTLFDDINARGGRAVMCKTGHSLIKAKMKEEKALLAGEMSGHLFFADGYFGFDDAIYASLRLVELLARRGQSIASLLADLPELYATPEIRLDCPDAIKFAVVERIKQSFASTYRIIDIDGARIEFEKGWGLIRASNTQPVLVLRVEAESPQERDRLRGVLESAVAKAMAS